MEAEEWLLSVWCEWVAFEDCGRECLVPALSSACGSSPSLLSHPLCALDCPLTLPTAAAPCPATLGLRGGSCPRAACSGPGLPGVGKGNSVLRLFCWHSDPWACLWEPRGGLESSARDQPMEGRLCICCCSLCVTSSGYPEGQVRERTFVWVSLRARAFPWYLKVSGIR